MKKQRVLVVDNYDSFTYNLVHMIQEIHDGELVVKRNDELTMDDVASFDSIVLSPGPGLPSEAGLLKEIIATFADKKKIFGVCLGMQAIGEVFGCQLKNLDKVFHGYQTTMQQTGNASVIFKNIEREFIAGRYHSWVIDKDSISDQLIVTAIDDQGEWMAIEHKSHKVYAVQFHPESIMTPDGKQMLINFLSI